MKRSVYVDTAYLVALLDSRDRLHKSATRLTLELERDSAQLLTSDGVITEFGNYFARSPLRADAAEWIHALRTDTAWLVTPIDGQLQRRGERRYRKHLDKAWSITDCVSMEIMLDEDLLEVATSDVHFEQAGFKILLK